MAKFSYPLFLNPSLKKLTSAYNALVDHINTNVIQVAGTVKGDIPAYTGDGFEVIAVGDDDQILIADSSTNTGYSWAWPRPQAFTTNQINSIIGNMGAYSQPSAFFTKPLVGATGTVTAYYIPILIQTTTTLSDLVFGNINAVGTDVKMALYDADVDDLFPGTIHEAAPEYTTALGAATTIEVPFTAPITVPPGLYWVGIMVNANMDVYGLPDGNRPNYGYSSFHSVSAFYSQGFGTANYTTGFTASPPCGLSTAEPPLLGAKVD